MSEQAVLKRAEVYAEQASSLLAREGELPRSFRTRGRALILNYYKTHGRDFPWRRTDDPYAILLSEVMLQQTQTGRVVEYYGRFLGRYPAPGDLAGAPLRELLLLWKGLGYNRRALMLQQACRAIVTEHGGRVPLDEQSLRALPGIGPYTARAILAFAAGRPTVFIETNIRTVFLHLFFRGRDRISDREIEEMVSWLLPRRDPRGWYYALMDFGVLLKRELPSVNRQSRHYRPQSRFEGSNRQLRANLLHQIASGSASTVPQLVRMFEGTAGGATSNDFVKKVEQIITMLRTEGLVELRSGKLHIPR